jgi:hypothetical protein
MEPAMTMRYVVVRYVSDLTRDEPKNIGIVLASEKEVIAKFVGEKGGKLDLRKVRSVVPHTGTYKQWIDYWRYIISQHQETERSLDQVLASSRGNFIAKEGETVYLPREVAINPQSALRHLYYLLVEEFPQEGQEETDLNERCEEIIKQYELRRSPYFKEGHEVEVTVDSVVQRIIPSYSWVNGVEIYFQKVSLLAARRETTQRNVNNAAWIFERLKRDNRDRQAKALFKMTDSPDTEESQAKFDPMEYIPVLKRLADEVINVDDNASVERTFARLIAN